MTLLKVIFTFKNVNYFAGEFDMCFNGQDIQTVADYKDLEIFNNITIIFFVIMSNNIIGKTHVFMLGHAYLELSLQGNSAFFFHVRFIFKTYVRLPIRMRFTDFGPPQFIIDF